MVQTQSQTLTLKFDGQDINAPRGATILEAAQGAGIYIPTLCYDPRLKAYGACRMCVVQQLDQEGKPRPGFPAACVTPATDGVAYRTNTIEIVELRKSILNLLVSEHPHGCLTCDRIVHCGPNDICLRNVTVNDRCVVCPQNQRCELQATVEITGVSERTLKYTYRTLPIRTEDPYIDRDYNLCIACARCVRICDEVVGAESISMTDRGDRILPGTPNDVPLADPLSGCIFCGMCVEACPVGALTEKENKWAGLPDRVITTTCPHCEVGCQVSAEMRNGKLLRVIPDIDGGPNGGLACVKGKFQLADEARREDRLLRAHVRRDGALQMASWEEGIAAAAEGFKARKGAAFALVVSGKVANEDAYLLQKFARAVMGSSNVETTARAGSAATAELAEVFGLGVSTNPIRDIAGAKCVLYLGQDLELSHPVAAFQVHKALNYQDAELIALTAEPYPELTRAASQWLRHTPGTEPALLRAMLAVIVQEKLGNQDFITNRTEDYEALARSVEGLDLDAVAREAGMTADAIRRAARTFARIKPATIVYAAGAETGIAPLLANLALVTGNVGRPATGVHFFRNGVTLAPSSSVTLSEAKGLPPTSTTSIPIESFGNDPQLGTRTLSARAGQGNTQGVLDMGCAPDTLPGYAPVTDADARRRFEQAWGSPLPSAAGVGIDGIAEGILAGRIKALYWVGDGPNGTTQESPLPERLQAALDRVEFLVVQGLAPADLTERAHVLLPAAAAMEREGTYTNAERRIQRVRAFLPPPGDCRPVWQAPAALAQALGARGFDYTTPQAVFAEVARLVPQYAGVTYESLDRSPRAVTPIWPLQNGQGGADILYTQSFPTPTGKAKFAIPASR